MSDLPANALLQVADTGPVESLALMLRSIGIRPFLMSKMLCRVFRELGCDTVLEWEDLRRMGYEAPNLGGVQIPEMTFETFQRNECLLFDVKAHRNGPKLWAKFPQLQGKTYWYRINGGKPERVPGHGDEIDPPCPVVTPDLWYATDGPWADKSYAFWPPFYRFGEYYSNRGRIKQDYSDPICLIHNLSGWGYGALIKPFRDELKIKLYGSGSPDGLVPHHDVPNLLSNALCMVHLKSSDAPGSSLYEALAAACPVVCTRRLIWRNRMEELLVPNETCLVFDRETHDPLTPQDVLDCTQEVKGHLATLLDPKENERIGMNGLTRLKHLMWKEKGPPGYEDLDRTRFRQFLLKHTK